jgi:LmbE family N-acetylglucosaminyl deacetylase
MKKNYTMKKILLLLTLFTMTYVNAQTPEKWTSGDIHEGVKKLNVLASALYVAAHPDDENTRLIAYLANHKYANTAYLSMTRGDGGQNLIGPEIRELLGVIRTQELLAARSVDGGQQFFTRANDFGYSKHPDETFNIWNKEVVKQDVVHAIRKFKPDVIIARFSEEPGRTHGHHTASAMLASEAFDLAANPKIFPEQVKELGTWQANRLLFNTSWWFYGSRDKFAEADKKNLFSVDVGVYYPIKGKSNTEIAAESRSMHKCQGFGTSGSRGTQLEYLEFLKGEKPDNDIFDGINTSWTRVKNGGEIGELVAKIDNTFRYDNPSASLEDLLAVRKMISALPNSEHWKHLKLAEVEKLIYHCAGFFFEATANDFSAVTGEEVSIKIEAINRSNAKVFLKSVTFLPENRTSEINEKLENNTTFVNAETITIPEDMPYGSPFWLQGKNPTLGMYDVPNSATANMPQNPVDFKVQFNLTINGQDLIVEKPIVYKRADPVKAEVYRPFVKLPEAYVSIKDDVYVFADNSPKTVEVVVKSGKANIGGMLRLDIPKGWKCEPEELPFTLELKGATTTARFTVYPPKKQSVEKISAVARFEDGSIYTQSLSEIAYDHIPVQTVLMPATAKFVRVDLVKKGENVGYIMGAGDDIPASLEQIGYKVSILENKDLTAENLVNFDAVILGIRAYNTIPDLKYHQAKLMEYIKNGGTVIVQYNTSSRLVLDDLAPYPLKLSRDRVAVEEAKVRILAPKHEVMNTPNKITANDFENWVQERGLYFPNEWDKAFTPILSANDPGETPKDGGLLVAEYGEGYYIYSGYSWFRELPAGVPGAFRIFTNLISIGKE